MMKPTTIKEGDRCTIMKRIFSPIHMGIDELLNKTETAVDGNDGKDATATILLKV